MVSALFDALEDVENENTAEKNNVVETILEEFDSYQLSKRQSGSRSQEDRRSDCHATYFERDKLELHQRWRCEGQFPGGQRGEPHPRFPSLTGIPPTNINYTQSVPHASNVRFKTDRPIGFCVDIGAAQSVVGYMELNHLLQHLGGKRGRLNHSVISLRFSDSVYQSLRKITPPRKTQGDKELLVVELDGMKESVPAL